MSLHKFITKVCNVYRLFWDVTPVLRMYDPLSCIFHFLAIIKLMEWSHFGRVARRVVVSGVWPLSLILPPFVLSFNAGIKSKALSLGTLQFTRETLSV